MSQLNGFANVTLPFSFPYFGTSYEGIQVYVYGYVSFDLEGSNIVPANVPFPTTTVAERRVHIAPFWDFHFPRGDDVGIHTAQVDENTFVIQWSHFSRTGPVNLFDLNWQLVLWLSAGSQDPLQAGRDLGPPSG